MGVMTGTAHIRFKGLMGVLALRCVFRLRMACKTELTVLFQQQFLVLGGMRAMARQAAFSSRDRCVGNGALFSFVGMATEAYRVARAGEKLGVLRIMGIMAGKTHAPLERSVLDSTAGLEPGLVVALIAEVPSTLERTERFSRCGGVMARIAGGRSHGVMGARLEEFGLG